MFNLLNTGLFIYIYLYLLTHGQLHLQKVYKISLSVFLSVKNIHLFYDSWYYSYP